MEVGIKEFSDGVEFLMKRIAESRLDIRGIYAIPRGGIPLGIALSSALGIPMVETPNGAGKKFTLIVDDIVDSGETIRPFVDLGYLTACLHINYHLPVGRYPTFFYQRVKEDPSDWVKYFWEGKQDSIEDNVRRIIQYMGDDPGRPGLLETPARVARMYQELSRGYREEEKPKLTTIPNGEDGIFYDQMLKDEGYFYSLCEHHIIPFFGDYYYGYIPDKLILGASKIGRLIDYYSARLQIAERLVHQVVTELDEVVKPHGQILIMKGRHLCKEMRGLRKTNSPYEAIAVRGYFAENRNGCKDEFLARIGK